MGIWRQGLVAGDTITAATRTGFTVTLSYTTRVALENVVIHAAGNMAITEFQGGGGNTYTNVSLVPRSADRPLASNADGFHSSGMRLGPTLSGVTMKSKGRARLSWHLPAPLEPHPHTFRTCTKTCS